MSSLDGRFVWYELSATKPGAAIAFYRSVLGWNTAGASGAGSAPYTFFIAGGVPVAGLMTLPANAKSMGAAPQWTGYVAVSDVDGVASRAKSLGATILMPPTDVPNVSRFCVIGDLEMATIIFSKGLGQNGAGQQQPGPPRPVIWHELNSARPQAAFEFYSALVGWRKGERYENTLGIYQEFGIGNEPAGGIISKPEDWQRSFWRYYFRVDGIEAAASRVQDGGGKVFDGTILLPNGSRIAYCADPEGASFGLIDTTVRIKVGCYAAQNPPEKRGPEKS